MTKSNERRTHDFLRDLKEALGDAGHRSRGIVDEVRHDLEAHIERLRADGYTEDEAVARALEGMGNPYELAHRMRRELPPFSGNLLTVIRIIAASAVVLWTGYVLWHVRAGTYGFDPTVYAIVGFVHLPAILLLWPRIVWRKNWLFGLVPAGLVLAGVMIFALGGTQTSHQLTMAMEGQQTAAAPDLTAPSDDANSRRHLVAAALTAITIILLMAIQQRAQRQRTILALLLVIGSIEALFQLEEFRFRQDRIQLLEYQKAFQQREGAYPTKSILESEGEGPKLSNSAVRLNVNADAITLFWSRPFSSGYALVYSSTDNRIRVQD